MRTMFNSVTRIFRRRSLFSLSASARTTASASASASSPPRKNKSRHELVSEAHVAYMQEHQQRQQERERWSRQPRRSSSSAPPRRPRSPSCSSMASSMYVSEDVLSLSPFDSLCLELRSVEDSIYRSLRTPASGYASDPIYFHL